MNSRFANGRVGSNTVPTVKDEWRAISGKAELHRLATLNAYNAKRAEAKTEIAKTAQGLHCDTARCLNITQITLYS